MTSSEKLDSFVEWMKLRGFVLSDALRFAEIDGVRGVVAVKDMPARSLIYSAPLSTAFLAPFNSPAFAGLEAAKELRDDPWTALIVTLMAEKSLGSASEFAPYLDILPQPGKDFEATANPLLWPAAARESLLKGTETERLLGLDDIRATFESVALPVFRANEKMFGGRDTEELFREYLYFGCMVMGRGFDAHPEYDGPVMTPMADMLNHRTGFCNSHLEEDEEDDDDDEHEEHEDCDCHGDERISMYTIADVQAGKELINTFGDRSNGELLRRYGFTDPVNEFDCVGIPLEYLGKPVILRNMVKFGCASPDGFTLTKDLKLEPELRKALRLCSGTKADRVTIKKVGKVMTKDLTKSEWQRLCDACRKRLADYPTTIDEDKELLAKESSQIAIDALRVRIGEKDILVQMITKCVSKIEK